MVKLQLSLIWPGCAQGKYTVRTKGFFSGNITGNTYNKGEYP